METNLTALLGTMVLVFGRAIQQQNVIHGNYMAAALTPMIIAAGDIAIIGSIVVDGWLSWPWISMGGGIGAILAMFLYRVLRPKGFRS